MPRLDWEDVLSFCDRLTAEARDRGWVVVDFEFEPVIPSQGGPDERWFGVQVWVDREDENELEEFVHAAIAIPAEIEPQIPAIARIAKSLADRFDYLYQERYGSKKPAPTPSTILAPGQQPRPKDNVIQLVRPKAGQFPLPRGRR